MSRSQKCLAGLVILVGLGVAWWLVEMPAQYERRLDLVISTGAPGGTYILLGQQLARVLDEHEGEEIGSVTAQESAGSVENIERLVAGEAQLAFMIAPVLARDPHRDQIRVLLSLYTDRLQVVVHKDALIRRLDDLKGKRIYIGADGSGTKKITTEILRTFGISKRDYARVGHNASFQQASLLLQDGLADAAFIVASTPANAVSAALGSGKCELLDLKDDANRIAEGKPGEDTGLRVQEIPARIYKNQAELVRTVGANALLVSGKGLDKEVVIEIEDALFDNIGALAEAHIRAQDIRLDRALKMPTGVTIHPGSERFQKEERKRLLIATGTINGKDYHVGKRIELALRQNGIPARATHTDGSLENLEILATDRQPAIAIVQYDAALASHWSPSIYHTSRKSDDVEIPPVKGLKRIATLHEEKIHVLIRRDQFPNAGEHPTISILEGKDVCVGPEQSGTRLLAEALLHHHGITVKKLYLSVPDMVDRIRGGEIHAGFFMSHVPSEALKSVVHDPKNRLLAIDPRRTGGLLGSAIALTRIEPNTYGAQWVKEPAIETVGTWAVLVTREDLPFDVEAITRVVFRAAAFCGISGSAEDMARDLSSPPLHPGAQRYYEEHDLLPTKEGPDWLRVAWRSLGILVILVGGYRGLLSVRRDHTKKAFQSRINAVSLDADRAHSNEELLAIRKEIRYCAQLPAWKARQLDHSRVIELEGLILERAEEAKGNLKRSILKALRDLRSKDVLDDKTRGERYAVQENGVWLHLENGELDPSQHKLLLEAIRDGQRELEGQAR